VLKGVGAATVKKLEAKGLRTVVDAAFVLPSRYEDRRSTAGLDAIAEGDIAVVRGTIGAVRQGFARGRFMASMEIRATQPDGSTRNVTARWFHRVHGLNAFSRGGEVIAIGPIKPYKGQLTMAHPELRAPDDPGPAIAVRYPAVEGIAPRTVSRVVRLAVERLLEDDAGFVDALPREIATAHDLPTQLEALAALHLPADDAPPEIIEALARGSSRAHRRLAFDEFFFFQLALLRDRAHLRERPAHVRPDPSAFDRERLRACLPFEPTRAQWRVLDELARDMGDGPPMLRLLQGDVGSGKTAVAFASAIAIARSGAQTALMAPTEILAEQHLRTLAPWCERAGLQIGLLTGATPRAARTSLIALLGAGKIDLLVGTHALLTDDVHFAELGLVVVDEQHRFGVQQRAILRRKGEVPHLLVMTATPIPRTMALTAYGQLEVSIIDELPPGRTPPVTTLHTGGKGLLRARTEVARHVASNHRAFVVCPLVEASDALDVTDVEATAAALRELMPRATVEVIHGRMSSRDKDEIMARFRTGKSDVLVATTVIEVGVDVPEATVMMVEHAERFGLAQLHQLRGRVGRGGGASWCMLHTGQGPASDAVARLSILTETHDGFVVAERDLELRGPGEVLGTRQAGAPRLRFAGFAGEGTKLLVEAREAARALLDADPGLRRHPQVIAELERRNAADAAVTADAG
jgi:ATP-dependent DNA helicase RecG